MLAASDCGDMTLRLAIPFVSGRPGPCPKKAKGRGWGYCMDTRRSQHYRRVLRMRGVAICLLIGWSGLASAQDTLVERGTAVRLAPSISQARPDRQDRGWVVDERTAYAAREGHLLKTQDAGETWQTLAVPGDEGGAPVEVYGVEFPSGHGGWLFTSRGLWRSDGRGTEWREIAEEGRLPVFSDAQHGWLRVDEGQPPGYRSYVTRDGGASWMRCPAGARAARSPVPYATVFASAREGFAIGVDEGDLEYRYWLLHTEDGGCSWRGRWGLPTRRDDALNALYFLNVRQGWIGGDGPVYYTADGGRHWRRLSTIPGIRIDSIYFEDARRGWLLGFDFGRAGGVFSTNDGGRTWTRVRPDRLKLVPRAWNRGRLAAMIHR